MEYDWITYWEDYYQMFHRIPTNTLSHEFQQYLTNVPLVTVFPVQSRPTQKEKVNPFFEAFLKEQNFDLIPEDKWRLPELSIAKSYQEVSKYWDEKEVKLDEKIWLLAQEMVYIRYAPLMRGAGQLSIDDVINDLDRSSSPGFYYNQKFQCTGDLIDWIGFRKDLKKFDDAIQEGRPLPEIYVSSLKRAELRKVGKNPRTFMGSGKRMLVWKHVLYRSQNDRLVKHYRDIWIKVGMSTFHRGYHDLFQQIERTAGKNAVFIDSDVSGWDRSVPEVCMRAVHKLRRRFWPENMRTEKNFKRANVLEDLTINSFILLENGEVVRKSKGEPSGDGNTIDDNSWIHEMVVNYSLLMMIPRAYLNTLTMMDVYTQIYGSCEFAFMGDDNLGGINLDKFPWFSADAMRNGYAAFGFQMKQISTGTNLLDREFLSRGFILKNGIYLPKVNREKVLCSMMYGNKGLHPKEMFQRAIALTRESWSDTPLFEVLRKYLLHYAHHFELDLKSEDEKYPSWFELQSQLNTVLDNDVIKRLYCSHKEGSVTY